MTKISRKVTSAEDFGASKTQNRFAHAKLALRGMTHMTRRDGLSSRESNILWGSGEIEWQSGWDKYVLFTVGTRNFL